MAYVFFSKTINSVIAETRFPVLFVLIGSDNEKFIGEGIVQQSSQKYVKNLMGLTTLPTLMNILKRSSLLLTNDTGPMHLAAALGVPTVSLFGPTSPEKTGPFGKKHKIFQSRASCAPCFYKTCPLIKQKCFFDGIDANDISSYITNFIRKKYHNDYRI